MLACQYQTHRLPSPPSSMIYEELSSYSSSTPPSDSEESDSAQHGSAPRNNYDDIFKALATPPIPLTIDHPPTPKSPGFKGDYPSQATRPPRARTPQSPLHLQSAIAHTRPKKSMPLSPSSPTSQYAPVDILNGGPIYFPSRSLSTRSVYRPSSTAATSRSSSGASRRSTRRPAPSPLPTQPSRHNSLAELHARQINIVKVQQPVSPYAGAPNTLEKARYAVTGIVRRKTSGPELVDRGAENEVLRKKSSFARLGDMLGNGNGVEGGRRSGAREANISKNF